MTKEKFDVYTHVTDQIVAQIEAGTPPWRRPWTGGGLLAFIIYVVVFTDGATTHLTLLSIGWCFLVIGIFDLVASRGRHVGWPFLTLTGVFALAAAYFY